LLDTAKNAILPVNRLCDCGTNTGNYIQLQFLILCSLRHTFLWICYVRAMWL
jgi:hypothetical protein